MFDTLGFIANIIATTFGVFLGLWTTTIRENIVTKRNLKQLFQTSFVEIIGINNNFAAILNGIRSGELPKLLNLSPSEIMKLNTSPKLVITEKVISDLKPRTKVENEIFYLILQNHSNVIRLGKMIENNQSNDLISIEHPINIFKSEIFRLAWNLRNFYLHKNYAYDSAEIEELLKQLQERKDLTVFLETKADK